MTDRQEWHDRIVGALGAVLAVAIVVGVIIGGVVYAAARMTGLTGGHSAAEPASSQTSTAASPSPSAPTSAPTSAEPSPTAKPTAKKTAHASHHKQSHHKHRTAQHTLVLSASPHHVGSMGRIDLYGRYPGHDGTTLVVQRREGGHWSDFPVSATVRGGRFHTWVASGQSGANHFRVVDGSGRSSDPVVVHVG